MGGVDATDGVRIRRHRLKGDFVAVVGARGFDELFLDFDAADGTEREGVLDAQGKIAAAGTDVRDGTSSAFRVRHDLVSSRSLIIGPEEVRPGCKT